MKLNNGQKPKKAKALWTTLSYSGYQSKQESPSTRSFKKHTTRKPIERKKEFKPTLRKPVRRRSKKMTAKMTIYNQRTPMFLKHCLMCPVAFLIFKKNVRPTTVHHMRGRAGSLLLDERFWLGLSLDGHRWVEDNKQEAARHGWIDLENWNTTPERRAEREERTKNALLK